MSRRAQASGEPVRSVIRKKTWVMCTALIAACTGAPSAAERDRLAPVNSAEHAVLSAVIRDAVREAGAEYAVYDDSTLIFLPDHVKPERLAAELRVPAALVRDLTARNRRRYPLRPAFGGAGGERLITAAEVRTADTAPAGWSELERRFPGFAGVAIVSRVSFTADSSQAIAFYGIRCGDLCGRTSVVRVDRVGGEWRVAAVALDYRG